MCVSVCLSETGLRAGSADVCPPSLSVPDPGTCLLELRHFTLQQNVAQFVSCWAIKRGTLHSGKWLASPKMWLDEECWGKGVLQSLVVMVVFYWWMPPCPGHWGLCTLALILLVFNIFIIKVSKSIFLPPTSLSLLHWTWTVYIFSVPTRQPMGA